MQIFRSIKDNNDIVVYSVEEVAQALGKKPEEVRGLVRSGALRPKGAGITKTSLVSYCERSKISGDRLKRFFKKSTEDEKKLRARMSAWDDQHGRTGSGATYETK